MSLVNIDSTLNLSNFDITSTSTGRLEFKEKKRIISPVLEVVKSPQVDKKNNSKYSIGVKFYESSKLLIYERRRVQNFWKKRLMKNNLQENMIQIINKYSFFNLLP